MTQIKLTRHEAIKKFEKAGESAIRFAFSRGHYSSEVREWARVWLAEQERVRNESSQVEQLDIARSAKDAAWAAAEAARDAAREAKTANTIATLALIAAVIAIAFSIVGIFVS